MKICAQRTGLWAVGEKEVRLEKMESQSKA